MKHYLAWAALAAAVPSLALAQAAAPPKPAPAPAPADKDAPKVGEVVVTGQTAPPVRTSIDRRSYSVSGDLQAQSGSVADALRNIPSVEVDVQGNLSLRGDPNVTILIDGKPSSLFQGDNKAQALQQLPADQIDRVEVITNPSAEFRADGSGGIINLVTKKARGAGRTGSLRLNLGSGHRAVAGASVGYNSKKLTLAGDLGYRHDTQKLAMDEDRRRLVAGGFDDTLQQQTTHFLVDSYTGRAAADYDLDAVTRLSGQARFNVVKFDLDSLAHFNGEDPLGASTSAFNRTLDIHQQRANGQVSAGLRRKFKGAGHDFSLNFSYDFTNDDRVRSGQTQSLLPAAPDAFDQQRIDNRLTQADLKGDYVHPMDGGVTLKLGFDIQRDDNRYNNRGYRGPAAGALTPDAALTNLFLYRQTLSQAYVTYEHPFGPLTVLAGLRVEDAHLDLTQVTQGLHNTNDYARLYPTLHLAWKLDDNQQITASYSHRVQRPGPEEFNAFRFLIDPLNYRAGNPGLKPQETHSLELGYQLHKGPALYLATLYYRENYNGVADVVTDLGGGVFLTSRANLAQSRNGGMELVANGRLSKTLSYNLSGNLFWSQLDSLGPGFPAARSIVTASGRGNINWQVTGADLVQVNFFVLGKRLTPQGYGEPIYGLNLGYRHKITDHVAFVMTVQDALGTFKDRQVIDTATLKTTTERNFDSRMVLVGFTWTFGGGKQRDPGFDFQSGSAPPQ
ncbi:MAG: TonB-dependent receptor [Caulobacter sp.]|nr:TonB-dependent receptor [Caulobacter sp.]